MSSPIAVLTDASIDRALASDKPVLLEFSASWCAPCQALAPVLEEAAQSFGDRVKFAVVDVDANPEAARRFDVRSVPTLILLRGGEQVRKHFGMMPKSRLLEWLRAAA